MKLIQDTEMGWCIDSKTERISIAEFCRRERIRQDITASALNGLAGLTSNTYAKFEAGATTSLKVGIAALEALGFELFVFGGKKNKSEAPQ